MCPTAITRNEPTTAPTTAPTTPASAVHDLSDQALIEAFETLTLEPGGFDHAQHVRLAFAYLRRLDLPEALGRYRRGLRALTARHGASDKYHDTVTCALLVLIHQRVRSTPEARTWAAFAAAHPDLLRFRGGPLFDHYDPSILTSPVARATFVLPERAARTGDGDRGSGGAEAAR